MLPVAFCDTTAVAPPSGNAGETSTQGRVPPFSIKLRARHASVTRII
jgi:hypothetical protein